MTTEQIQDEIQQFFNHFGKVSVYYQEQLTSKSRCPANYELLPGKLACYALLDGLSVARFPDEKGARKRFCEFVRQFSTCDHWDRVSIPQVLYGLQRSVGLGHERLMKHAETYLAHRQGYAITNDPLCSELVKSFPESENVIKQYCHLFLFYDYRCALVHELRQPGYGYEFDSTLKPCYQSQLEISTEEEIVAEQEASPDRLTFQLTYPLKFFFSLCDECINGLEQYFLKEEKSPFSAYESRFGDAWR